MNDPRWHLVQLSVSYVGKQLSIFGFSSNLSKVESTIMDKIFGTKWKKKQAKLDMNMTSTTASA